MAFWNKLRPRAGNRQGERGNGTPGPNNRTVFRVMVPENIQPGEEFQVYAGTRIVRVRCPLDSQPGQYLQITVPTDTGRGNSGSGSGNGSTPSTLTNNNNNNNDYNNPSSNSITPNTATEEKSPPRRRISNESESQTNGIGNSSSSSSLNDFQEQQQQQQQQQQQEQQLQLQQQRSQYSPEVRRISGSNPPAYMVPVPEGVLPGEKFPVTIRGLPLMVTCPRNAAPGISVRIVPPPMPDTEDDFQESSIQQQQQQQQQQLQGNASSSQGGFGDASMNSGFTDITGPQEPSEYSRQESDGPPLSASTSASASQPESTQLFEVTVPRGVQPGAPFALLAGGVRVLVNCPDNAGPGQKIRFRLPLALTQAQNAQASNPKSASNEMHRIRLKYDRDGWTRSVRLDLKFQWIRIDDKGELDMIATRRFHMEKSAYVRRLRFLQGEDPRIRNGLLDLVPATESVVDSTIKSTDGRELLNYGDLARAQIKSFDEKAQWFQDTCAELCVVWDEGHMRMNIRRQYLLGDSVDAVMSLSRKDLRKSWRFEFIGEMGIDAGGLAREWFELVCQEIFDPDMGLWVSSATNQMSMDINPASEYCCEDHLVYYRFLGRVMGKAMFDRQLVIGHMVKHLYKHILGWPIYFKDLESVDEEYYNNIKQLQSMHDRGEDISVLCLDFTITTEMMGVRNEVELVKDGADIDVTNDNFPEYVEACLKYKLMGSVKPQLNELLLGFFDVIPEPLLTIFDYQELELIMCGLPHIDLDDWKTHTEYSGEFEEFGVHHPKVEWFWETLEEFNDEMRARLLLFVTGTSGVPSRGFGVLQSNDGNIRNFTIHGVSAEICFYPRAHTCFNRIDLPLYDNKEQLQERLKLAVTMSATGFDIE